MSNGIKVVKRNGSLEPLNLEKMHIMAERACEGLAGVSASQVEIQSGIQFLMVSLPQRYRTSLSSLLVTLLI